MAVELHNVEVSSSATIILTASIHTVHWGRMIYTVLTAVRDQTFTHVQVWGASYMYMYNIAASEHPDPV